MNSAHSFFIYLKRVIDQENYSNRAIVDTFWYLLFADSLNDNFWVFGIMKYVEAELWLVYCERQFIPKNNTSKYSTTFVHGKYIFLNFNKYLTTTLKSTNLIVKTAIWIW